MKYDLSLQSFLRALPVCALLGPLAGVTAGAENGDPALEHVAMGHETRELLRKYVEPELLPGIADALAAVDQNTLGPQPATGETRERLRGPAEEVPLTIGDGVEGRGTREAPYRGAIAAFLDSTEADGPVRVVVPAGHYEESGVEVPDGVWLEGRPGAVIQAAPDGADRGHLLRMGEGSGLVGMELDGSTSARRVDGVWIASGVAVIHDNYFHHLVGVGVRDRAPRYEAEGVLVFGNTMERLGHSGIRMGSGWVAESNVFRDTGIYRMGGMGWGGDAIIPMARRKDSRIANNLIFHSRRLDPFDVFDLGRTDADPGAVRNAARHGLATQKSERITMRGNLIVMEGSVRFAVALADHSNHNAVLGNVMLQLADADLFLEYGPYVSEERGDVPLAGWRKPDGEWVYDAVSRIGVVANGSHNRIAGNAILGTRYATNTGPPKKPANVENVVEHNFGRVLGQPVRVQGESDRVENNDFEVVPYHRIVRRWLKD